VNYSSRYFSAWLERKVAIKDRKKIIRLKGGNTGACQFLRGDSTSEKKENYSWAIGGVRAELGGAWSIGLVAERGSITNPD